VGFRAPVELRLITLEEREIIEERYPGLINKGYWSDIKIEVRSSFLCAAVEAIIYDSSSKLRHCSAHGTSSSGPPRAA
jgi:hypothetical protein